jgi:ADP-heptose:LPS heptosyltransferase
VRTTRTSDPAPPPLPFPPSRILLVLVAGIGDFVMATPAIRAMALGFPGARLTLLTTPPVADLARPCPYLHEILEFDLRAYRPGERGLGLRSWRRFHAVTADLRARRFGLALDLYAVASWMGAARMAILLSRVHADRTAGRWSRGRGIIFGVRSPDRPHEVDAMLALAATLGCPGEDALPTLWIPGSARQASTARLEAIGVGRSTPYAVLQTGSNKPEARLPAAKVLEIGRHVSLTMGLPLLLTGDASEAPHAESLCHGIGRGAHSLAGRTNLLELAAILEAARLVVTTDSGPMHMAVAAGAPTVVLFGPGDPDRFGPRGSPGQIALLRSRTHPRDPERWHADLTADAVVQAAPALLRGRRPHAGSA